MNKAEILNKAADLLSEPGNWGQGAYGNWGGCMCLIGGVARAQGQGVNQAEEEFGAILGKALGFTFVGWDDAAEQVIRWNDEKGRTAEEVVAVLRKAAELAA